jgi:hypothetical protein
MTELMERLDQIRLARFVRGHLYVIRMLAIGLIAVGMSGAACQLVGYSLGDHALAADSQVAQPSAERCAEYMEYAPGKPTCAAAEMAHHADEIVEYRLAAGLFGVFALTVYAGWRWVAGFTDDEAQRQLHRYLLLASVTFGLAAAVLLGIGIGALLGGGDAAPRWFVDGGVAAVVFTGHGLWLRTIERRAALP